MKKTIYLNAGHSDLEPGALSQYGVERDLNITIRDLVTPLLEAQGFKVKEVPDSLKLPPSILWINTRARRLNDGLAFGIHQNCCGGKGAESYYYKKNKNSKELAQRLIDTYCKITGLKNRGAKSSSKTRWGRLGFIEDTNCWATLIECGFIDNKIDMKFIIENFDKVAEGIAKGICKIYGIKYKEKSPQVQPKSREEKKKQIIKLVKEL